MRQFLRKHWKDFALILVGFALLGSQLLFGLYAGFMLGRFYGRRYRLRVERETERNGVKRTRTRVEAEADA